MYLVDYDRLEILKMPRTATSLIVVFLYPRDAGYVIVKLVKVEVEHEALGLLRRQRPFGAVGFSGSPIMLPHSLEMGVADPGQRLPSRDTLEGRCAEANSCGRVRFDRGGDTVSDGAAESGRERTVA